MLTTKQKQQLWNAGNNDTVVDEILSENAKSYLDSNELGIKEKDSQEAIEIYRKGFYGEDIKALFERLKD